MASIDTLKASDGTGNASVATVQSVRSPGATTLVVDTVQGINTKFHATMGTPHTFVDPVTSETITVISEATAVDFVGHVDGSNLEIDTIAPGFTDAGSAVNDIVIIKPTTQWADEVANVLEVSLENDGTLQTDAVLDALGLNSPLDGWNPGLPAPNTVTYNGNRSYDLVFNSTDLTDTLSPGMRLRTTRTVAAPTQCTSLNGTSQYYSKSSPAGMTFTDDFVAGAWVKLSAYPVAANAGIISRYNGTSGWSLYITPSGTVTIIGYNGGPSNQSNLASYQSIPLNKWVHIAAQADMSAFTNTPTTGYIMIDGVDVPATYTRGGTNPTALVQAGNIEVGAYNGGTNPFPGKIAQAFVSSAKITQANVRTLISQGLTSSLISSNNIVSAYSFNNSINDLNTTNANNLTASGSATATNADSPYGTQGSGLISSTLDYAIVQSATFSTNTTLTVQVPEGCTIPTSGGVSAVAYSAQRNPYGFPGQRGKWRLTSMAKTLVSSGGSVSPGTWLNTGYRQFYLPIGSWVLGFNAVPYYYRTGTNAEFKGTLSTANNTESNTELTVASSVEGASGTMAARNSMNRETDVTISSATQYYLNVTAVNNALGDAGWLDSYSPGIIYAENAYL